MDPKTMEKFSRHCDRYLGQECDCVIHPQTHDGFHVDILLYAPTVTHPYWKLVTMGAGDYKMPAARSTLPRRNEYIMLVDKDVDMKDKESAGWYFQKLWMIAMYPRNTQTYVTYGHAFKWENEAKDDEMIAAFIEFPQMFDYGILHFKAGLCKDTACLLVVLLNRGELERLMKIGAQRFSEYLFPEDGEAPRHFLTERKRSEKF